MPHPQFTMQQRIAVLPEVLETLTVAGPIKRWSMDANWVHITAKNNDVTTMTQRETVFWVEGLLFAARNYKDLPGLV